MVRLPRVLVIASWTASGSAQVPVQDRQPVGRACCRRTTPVSGRRSSIGRAPHARSSPATRRVDGAGVAQHCSPSSPDVVSRE
jgi:hypothetical protein